VKCAGFSALLVKSRHPHATIAFIGPYRLFFFSYDCRERIHVHVARDRNEAKLWLDPVEVAFNKGYSAREMRRIEKIIQESQDSIRDEWDRHCGSATS
jgi:hypothetical protein